MSAAPQHGRRRAEPVRSVSRREARKASHTDAKVAGPAKRMAIVAVAGALLAGGGLAQAATNNATAGLASASLVSGGTQASAAPSAISAPTDVAIDFSRIQVSSTKAAKATSQSLSGAADAVTPVATPPATKAAAPAATKAAAPVLVDDPAAAQQYAAGQLAAHGWGADQMSCLTQLWNRESSWLTSAENASSGAYGIAQSLPAEKMSVAGADYRTNYKTQINWGLGYIEGRYGSPCGAWGHSNAVGWY
ncbi:hypothetical protein QO003_002977 [Arthrobacter silviterrae]|uniref:Lytic transglycosylase domain-containing protein n=1 Tax=Arthrobacter silviterrae TaxID=2026658 RepID=A0ABX0D8Z3_9MICC|nr:hypothetical protein [Arthrobacter silviterrae]MDQ0278674.1 hypothetical protein [Arthrobacter silviterrae]NGN83368.1 hypothetical protein [Arthrobacter silviterrae]